MKLATHVLRGRLRVGSVIQLLWTSKLMGKWQPCVSTIDCLLVSSQSVIDALIVTYQLTLPLTKERRVREVV